MPNPDQTFAAYQVVDTCLDLLHQLPIEVCHLQNCNVAKVLQLYAADRPEYGREISQKATKLLQRWQVSVFELSYEYDEAGLHELRHKELRRKLEVVRKSDKSDFLIT